MLSSSTPLSSHIQRRIAHTVSLSGVHDLRPLMKAEMNEILRLDAAEAVAESPALLMPRVGAQITCFVGG